MKRKLISLLLCFSAMAVVIPAAPAAAANPQGDMDTFDDGAITLCFDDSGGIDFGTTEKDVVFAGIDWWTQAITFTAGEMLTCPNVSADLVVTSANLNSGTCSDLASTTGPTQPNDTGQRYMIFNENCDFTWIVPPDDPDPAAWDAYTVVAHEFGHFLGLGHVDTTTETGDAITSDGKAVLFTFDNSDKKDVTHSWPTSPKWWASPSMIYSGSLDPGVGNFSSSPRPNLYAGNYLVKATIRNADSGRNPNGVKLELYQGTTLKYTSPFVSTAGQTLYVVVNFTAQADLRFRVQYSRAEIWDVEVFKYDTDFEDGNLYHQIMEPGIGCVGGRATTMDADSADGVRALYSALAVSGPFPDELGCEF